MRGAADGRRAGAAHLEGRHCTQSGCHGQSQMASWTLTGDSGSSMLSAGQHVEDCLSLLMGRRTLYRMKRTICERGLQERPILGRHSFRRHIRIVQRGLIKALEEAGRACSSTLSVTAAPADVVEVIVCKSAIAGHAYPPPPVPERWHASAGHTQGMSAISAANQAAAGGGRKTGDAGRGSRWYDEVVTWRRMEFP